MEIPGYKIEKELGIGGMSTVYLATQNSFGRKVALKVMSPTFASNKEVGARFIREAQIIAGLSHPHIVPVYDVGSHGALHYMSMDYLGGGDLVQWINRGLEIEEVLQIMESMASALHYAHGKGYIHRDIKPNNILFREDGSPVLTDFGISRLLNANDQLTQSGAIVGTPRYMSPEALQGKSIDGRSDLYSLGIVFYEMLMKEAPYQAEEYMVLGLKHITEPVPLLPKHFGKFQGFLEILMAKNPQDRYQSGLEIVKAIRTLRTGAPVKTQQQPDMNASDVRVGDFSVPENIRHVSGIKKVVAVPVKNIPSLDKMSMTQAAPANRPKERTEFGETRHQKMGFLKRYTFTCDMVVYDAASFSMIFSSLTTKLLEWHRERGSQGVAFVIKLTCHTALIELAKKRMDDLYHSEQPYDFVKKMNVSLFIKNIEDETEDVYVPGA